MTLKTMADNRGNKTSPANQNTKNDVPGDLTIIRALIEILIELNQDLIVKQKLFASPNLNTAAIEACEFIDNNLDTSKNSVENLDYIKYTLKHVLKHINEVIKKFNNATDIAKLHDANIKDFIESCHIVKNRLQSFLSEPDNDKPLEALKAHVDQILKIMDTCIRKGVIPENVHTLDFRNSCKRFKKYIEHPTSKESVRVKLQGIEPQIRDKSGTKTGNAYLNRLYSAESKEVPKIGSGCAWTGSGISKTGSTFTRAGSAVTCAGLSKTASGVTKTGSVSSRNKTNSAIEISPIESINPLQPKLGYFERSTKQIRKVVQSKTKDDRIREVVETLEVTKEKFDSNKTEMRDDNSLELDVNNMVKEIMKDKMDSKK